MIMPIYFFPTYNWVRIMNITERSEANTILRVRQTNGQTENYSSPTAEEESNFRNICKAKAKFDVTKVAMIINKSCSKNICTIFVT